MLLSPAAGWEGTRRFLNGLPRDLILSMIFRREESVLYDDLINMITFKIY
jgi:hypothetical protein